MMLPSHAHVQCLLNGHRITQWAADDPPYKIEYSEAVQVHHGHDGSHYPMSNGSLGGRLSFMLVPHSVDTKWCLDREKDRQSRFINRLPQEQFNGILQDVVTGIKLSLERGYLVQCHRFPVAGQSFEVTFDFERMIPEYESTAPFSKVGVYPEQNFERTPEAQRASER